MMNNIKIFIFIQYEVQNYGNFVFLSNPIFFNFA